MWRSYHSWWVRHIRAYGAPCKGVEFYSIGTKKRQRMADLSPSAQGHRSSILRMIDPDCLGSAEAHMQPNARCVVVRPCAMDGVLEPLACTAATHQVISRLLTSHPQNVYLQALEPTDDCTQTIHTDFSVTCFAQQQYHLAVSYLAMLHGYQPLVPPYPCHHSHPAPVHYEGAES